MPIFIFAKWSVIWRLMFQKPKRLNAAIDFLNHHLSPKSVFLCRVPNFKELMKHSRKTGNASLCQSRCHKMIRAALVSWCQRIPKRLKETLLKFAFFFFCVSFFILRAGGRGLGEGGCTPWKGASDSKKIFGHGGKKKRHKKTFALQASAKGVEKQTFSPRRKVASVM